MEGERVVRAGREAEAERHVALAFRNDGRRCGDVPRGEAVRLEDDDVLVGLPARHVSRDNLLQLVHLEPVEDARLDRLDEIGGLELRVLARVAADEGGALEDDVVELAPAAVVRADGADERAGTQPLAAQDGILRRRHGHDDVALAGVAVALARLGSVLLAERREPLLVAAVGDDALDARKRGADRGELRLGLPAAADQPEAPRARAGEMLRGDAARRAGAELAELVRLDHRDELGRVGAEEENDEARAVAEAGVDLRAGVAELEIGRRHHGKRSLLQPEPVARPVLDRAGRHAPEARLDRLHRIGRREELGDFRLGDKEGHGRHTRSVARSDEPVARALRNACVTTGRLLGKTPTALPDVEKEWLYGRE